jgi:hypothetical protein
MTGIIQTSYQARRGALFDEISKLASNPVVPKQDYLTDKSKPVWKRRLAHHVAAGTGAAIGSGLFGTLADKGIEKVVGSEKYQQMPDAAKLKFLLPLTALSMTALHYARRKNKEEREKYPR